MRTAILVSAVGLSAAAFGGFNDLAPYGSETTAFWDTTRHAEIETTTDEATLAGAFVAASVFEASVLHEDLVPRNRTHAISEETRVRTTPRKGAVILIR